MWRAAFGPAALSLALIAAACSTEGSQDAVPVAQSCTGYTAAAVGTRPGLLAYYRPGGYPILVAPEGDEPAQSAGYDTWAWKCGWVHMAGPDPHLLGYAMAYDPALHRTILAGPKTLAWNGSRWDDLGVHGPLNLGTTSMVFDVARNELLLVDSYPTGANTWTFDGRAWNKVSTTGPQNEAGAGLAYDPRSSSVLMFGGFSSGVHSAEQVTWRWDGQAWHLLEPDASPPGGPAAMAYDDATRQLILIGYDHSTWEWTGSTWRDLSVGAPTFNSATAMVYDPARQDLFLWNTSEAWTYTGTWAQLPASG